MIDAAYPPSRTIPSRRRPRVRGRLAVLVPVLAFGAVALPRLLVGVDAQPDAPAAPAAERFVVVSDRVEPTPVPPRRRSVATLFNPAPILGSATPTLVGSAPLAADLVPAAAPEAPALRLAAAPDSPTPARSASPTAVQTLAAAPRTSVTRLAEAAPVSVSIPLPVARPPELRPLPPRLAERAAERADARPTERLASRFAERPSTRRVRAAARQEAEAERSFFDAVFGAKPAAPEPGERPTVLAYAGPDAGLPARGGGGLFEPRPEGGTATYDITARTVTLPSGEVLEAHSGLGKSQDNPRDVHLRMRGATPPGTYAITEREALFHGVRALRLTPVGGSAAIHGRDGILAHTYMLGPSGASNGCVVFRNYDRFLQAYLRGEIRRLVVVAGRGDGLTSGVARLFGR